MEDAWRRNGEAIKAVKAVRWEKIGGSLEDDGRRIGGGLHGGLKDIGPPS